MQIKNQTNRYRRDYIWHVKFVTLIKRSYAASLREIDFLSHCRPLITRKGARGAKKSESLTVIPGFILGLLI